MIPKAFAPESATDEGRSKMDVCRIDPEDLCKLAGREVDKLAGVMDTEVIAAPGHCCRMKLDGVMIVTRRPVEVVDLDCGGSQCALGIADLKNGRLAKEGFELTRICLGLGEGCHGR